MVHVCHPDYMGKHKQEDQGPGQPGHKARPYLKIASAKKAGGVAQAIEQVLGKCKDLTSKPRTIKKKPGVCVCE
jgi:hypothetical protein